MFTSVLQFSCGKNPTTISENTSISSNSFKGCPSKSQTFSAQAGQRMNISILDFKWDASSTSNCKQNVGTIRDTISSNSAQICSGRERERQVMISNGNSIEVRINIQDPSFILQITCKYIYEVI